MLALSRMTLGFTLLAMAVAPAAADTIHLRNGDRIHGKVLELTEQEVKLHSEIHGIFKLPRDKVISITIGDPPPESQPAPRIAVPRGTTPRAGDAEAPPTVDQLLDRMVPKNFDRQSVRDLNAAAGTAGGTVEQVIDQLRAEGIPQGLMSELNMRLPGFASPAVQSYFNDRVGGLIDGSLNIEDIRRDAARAADELRSLQADLGPEGAALNGYLGILEGFLQSTAPAEPELRKPNPQPPARRSAPR